MHVGSAAGGEVSHGPADDPLGELDGLGGAGEVVAGEGGRSEGCEHRSDGYRTLVETKGD